MHDSIFAPALCSSFRSVAGDSIQVGSRQPAPAAATRILILHPPGKSLICRPSPDAPRDGEPVTLLILSVMEHPHRVTWAPASGGPCVGRPGGRWRKGLEREAESTVRWFNPRAPFRPPGQSHLSSSQGPHPFRVPGLHPDSAQGRPWNSDLVLSGDWKNGCGHLLEDKWD
jgi:hypothetical protein